MIHFTKMHGLGNDFVVIDEITQSVDIQTLPIKKICHRHIGIGCDQVLFIKKSAHADFACVIFNSDGSQAEQCGNGMRCIARFVHENKLIDKKSITIETAAGIVTASIHDYGKITVNMGTPLFDLAAIPFIADQRADLYELLVDDHAPIKLSVLSMGNPHAILRIDSVRDFPVRTLGAKISEHERFPQKTNVGFMEIVDEKNIRLRTFERGTGETLACGSNACAAVVAGIKNFSLADEVNVELPLGHLWIQWKNHHGYVSMTGPADVVFKGFIAQL